MNPLLDVSGLGKSFGGLVVAADLTLSLRPGDRVALIGPNGAGKTTFVNLVTGALAPDCGRIALDGEDITRAPETDRVRRGLVRTFQISRLFRDMSPREHVSLAILARSGRTGRLFARIPAMRDVVEEAARLLEEFGLSGVADRPVGEIAYGLQRLVEIAVALALRPKVLLLDEPAAGVPHGEAHRITDALERLPADLAVLMIEHDMDLVFRFAERVIVLGAGRVLFEGAPDAVRADPQVREAYLGSYAHGRRAA